MRLQIDWASLIVGSKFNVFVLFYFVFEGNFPSTSPRRTYIWTGLGAYIWRGLYMEGLIFGILRYTLIMLENLSIMLVASSSKQQLYAYYAGKVALCWTDLGCI